MTVPVQLSNDELIEPLSLCRAIARALRPAAEDGLEGIDCIVGRQVNVGKMPTESGQGQVPFHGDDCSTYFSDTATANEAPSSSEQECKHAEATEEHDFFLPFKLRQDDRALLERLLPSLPPLRYPMSEEDAAKFMQAYRELPERPAWEPLLVSARQVEQWKSDQEDIRRQHELSLKEAFAKQRLVAVDRNHVPVRNLGFGSYIPRRSAIEYLASLGIPYMDPEERGNPEHRGMPAQQPDTVTPRTADTVENQFPTSPFGNSHTKQASAIQQPPIPPAQAGSGGSGNARPLPDGVPTPDIASAFGDLSSYSDEQWKRILTEQKWPKVAMMRPGRRGKGGAALWNPVSLLLALKEVREKSKLSWNPNRYTKGFDRVPSLRPWLKPWTEYLESYERFSD